MRKAIPITWQASTVKVYAICFTCTYYVDMGSFYIYTYLFLLHLFRSFPFYFFSNWLIHAQYTWTIFLFSKKNLDVGPLKKRSLSKTKNIRIQYNLRTLWWSRPHYRWPPGSHWGNKSIYIKIVNPPHLLFFWWTIYF